MYLCVHGYNIYILGFLIFFTFYYLFILQPEKRNPVLQRKFRGISSLLGIDGGTKLAIENGQPKETTSETEKKKKSHSK